MNYRFSVQRFAHLCIVIFLLIYLLVIGKGLFVPVVFAVFLSYMLHPICSYFERYVHPMLAIIIGFLSLLIPIFLIIVLFGYQFSAIFEDWPVLKNKTMEGFNTFLAWAHDRMAFIPDSTTEISEQSTEEDSSIKPLNIIRFGVSSTSAILFRIVLTFIYTFLFLLYRKSIKNFILIQVAPERREKTREVIRKISSVSQRYINGLGLVVFILFCLNSLALWLIGIDYPMFWGALGAVLAIIPYVGSVLGGLLPFLYAIASTDTTWQPVAVAVVFFVIQVVEGNLITPKVIGASVKLNPFVAIFGLILGGTIWGVAGLVLALPMLAVIRIIFLQIDFLIPIALMLSSDLYDNEEVFMEEYDKEKYRFRSFFTMKNKIVK